MQKIIQMTQDIINGYGGVNGDHDTNHYSDDYGKSQGYRGAVAHGLLISGYAIGMAVEKYGKDFHFRGEFEHKYVNGTCPGDKLVMHLDDNGDVIGKVEDDVVVVGYSRLRQE